MVPVPIAARYSHLSRWLYSLIPLVFNHVPSLWRSQGAPIGFDATSALAKRANCPEQPEHKPSVALAVLIPILVLLSGLFAGLTLGYMSLDETQLHVLSISGTPKQREYANKIKPIRKNGHLLLVTLLLANMIVNETLPVIADPILGGGFQSVVVSTVLIVIFSEIIPQSLFTRHGLYLGAKMALFTKLLIYGLGIISWPVAKLLEFVLGPHHGIIYRRGELKELIAMHSSHATHGGDLKTDTVTIIGATLDLQEKVVKQAMTPISDVFMLSIDSKLDYDLLNMICQTGHSRVPVYEEIEVPISVTTQDHMNPGETPITTPGQRTQKVKKILGILLVKQCVLLDPKDATPLRNIPLNKVPFVPNNEPLLGILDKFQEGRSHMAIVSRFSVEKSASVKKAVKRGLTHRLRQRVGMGDSESSDTDSESSGDDKTISNSKRRGRRRTKRRDIEEGTDDGDTLKDDIALEVDSVPEESSTKENGTDDDNKKTKGSKKDRKKGSIRKVDYAMQDIVSEEGGRSKRTSFQLPRVAAGMTSMSMLEQSMPADAVLAKKGAEEFLQSFDPAVMPLGIITLEDVLEELIGEEIYDEFDPQGAHGDPYEVPPQETQATTDLTKVDITAPEGILKKQPSTSALPVLKPISLKGLGFLRSRSAPPTPRDTEPVHRNDEDASNEKGTESKIESQPFPSTMLQMPRPVRGNSRYPPSIIVEHSSSSSMSSTHNSPPAVDNEKDKSLDASTQNVKQVQATSSQTPSVLPALSIPLAHVAPSSRSASPAPSLEAILLDRKRRMASTANSNVITPATPGTTSVTNVSPPMYKDKDSAQTMGPVMASRSISSAKGARFKSSPLGGERAGIVIAEKINDNKDLSSKDECR